MFQTDPSRGILEAVRAASLLPRFGAGTDAKMPVPVETFFDPSRVGTTTTTSRQGPPLSSLERPGSVPRILGGADIQITTAGEIYSICRL